MQSRFSPKILTEGFPKRQGFFLKNFTPAQIEGQKGEVRQKHEAPKNPTSSCFSKTDKPQIKKPQPQSEREPQNEARFADCAIFGDRGLFRNSEIALAFLGKTSGQDFR